MTRSNKFYLGLLLSIGWIGTTQGQVHPTTDILLKFRALTNATTWKQTASVPLLFPAHHPQGMVKVGAYFFMSSVEVINREAGIGIGHLFKFDERGKLLADIKLGEGAMYHPGGIDYDGQIIWIPVAEYRANSASIVYKLDPTTLLSTEVFRFNDHLGGIVHNLDATTLHAVNWGSRTYYEWHLNEQGKIEKPASTPIPNPSFYIDYQDCHYVGDHKMLCGGLKNYPNGTGTFRLGGIELIDLTTHLPVHQVPFPYWSVSGKPLTQNPFWLESTNTGLKGYFIPDDNEAIMYVYEAEIK